MSANQILDREFLEIRAKLLEIAASLDRLERGSGSVADDSRMRQLGEAIDILRLQETSGRAEKLQLLFSLPYDDAWPQKYGVQLEKS